MPATAGISDVHLSGISEPLLRQMVESTAIGMAITTPDGQFITANPAYCDTVGYTLDELLTMDSKRLTHPDDRVENLRKVRQMYTTGSSGITLEKRYVTKSGAIAWVRCSYSLWRADDGEPTSIIVTTQDITERRQAEQRLRDSEMLLALSGALAQVGGWSLEVATGELTWTEQMYRILGYDKQVAALPVDLTASMFEEPYRSQLADALRRCQEHGTAFDLEVEVVTADGGRLWGRSIGEAQRDESGSIVRLFGAFQDIDERKRAEAERRQLTEQLFATLDNISDAFYTLDHNWCFTYLNSQAGTLLQVDPQAAVGQLVWDLFPKNALSKLFDTFDRALEQGVTQTVEDYFEPLDLWFSAIAYPTPDGVAVFVRDVGEARRAWDELARRDRRISEQAALLDKARDAILVRTLDHKITYWNASSERLYGWTADEAVGRSVRRLLYEDTTDFDRATATVLSEGEWQGEISQLTRDGSTITVEARWTLVHDDAGRPDTILAINSDVTERKKIEQQFLRAQRMESIGTLAGGIAHDINNVLSPIMMAVQLLEMDETDPERLDLLATMRTSAQHGADMVKQVLTFARGVEGERKPVDVVAVLSDVARLARDTFPRRIEVHDQSLDGELVVAGEATQIYQVLLNLALNARDAMEDGGTLTLHTERRLLQPTEIHRHHNALPGLYAVVSVTDTGTGMDQSIIDQLFDPFFTTKEPGKGTGLGLPSALAIVESHKGFIQVYSEVGQGTTFRIYLPVLVAELTGAEAFAADDTEGGELRGQGNRVLVVDDEAAMVEITRQMLEAHGYATLTSTDGCEALDLALSHDDLAAVVTDMNMPGANGLAVIKALRHHRPGLPVIAVSGLNVAGRAEEAVAAGARRFIAKPYTARTLLETIGEVLADRP